MSAKALDGRAVAATLKEDLAAEAAELTSGGNPPCLALLQFAGDEAAAAYGARLEALCGELEIPFVHAEEPADATTEAAVAAVGRLNDDPAVTGILILLPPPPQIETSRLVEAIDPDKDVDGAHPRNAAALYLGTPGPAPATALAVIELLRRYEVPLSGRDAVVVGRSDVIGKPLALLLLRENATVTVCHSRTADLARHAGAADLVIAATGRPGLLSAEMLSAEATVVDVGTNFVDGKMVGDVAADAAERVAALSPVPGGVGPLTNLMLVRNLLDLTRGGPAR